MENNTKEKLSHKVGDAVEKVGNKVSDMGANKIGSRITNAGDKLEHSQDEKPARNLPEEA